MKKQKISIILLGHSGSFLDITKIKNWKSDLFEISSVQKIEHLPETKVEDFYLDQKFDVDQLSKIIKCPQDSDIAVGIMPCRFVDNFYLHRVGKKCAIISLYGINEILSKHYISLENFILKQLYEITAIKCMFDNIATKEVYSIIHMDTRGCLFDMNGNRQDTVYNTEKAKICDSCKAEFKKKQIDDNIIAKFEKELKRIEKPFLQRVEIFIKKHPLLSILLSALIAIFLNLVASALWDVFKNQNCL